MCTYFDGVQQMHKFSDFAGYSSKNSIRGWGRQNASTCLMETENQVIVNLRIYQLCLTPQEKDPQR